MAEEFRDACQRIDADDDARLVVVTGSGGCFSIGRTRPGQETDEPEPDESEPATWSERLERLRVADALAALTVPVIVALNGDAIGHGLELALAGDLRLAAEGSRFALSEPDSPSFPRDAFPWDGGTQRLPRLIGPAWALDLALTGRQVDAGEALRLGLVNRGSGVGKIGGRNRADGASYTGRRPDRRPLRQRGRPPGNGLAAHPGVANGGRPERHPAKHGRPGRGHRIVSGEKAAQVWRWLEC